MPAYILTLLLAMSLSCFGQGLTLKNLSYAGQIAIPASALATPDLLAEDFTTGSIPAGWTTDVATPNFAYQWPALNGTYSLGLTNASATCRSPIAATANIKAYFQYMCTKTNTVDGLIFSLDTGAGEAVKLELLRDSGSKLLFVSDTGSAHFTAPATFIQTNVLYHIWVHYTAGTGANAFMSVAFNTTASEPVSGANYAQIVNGVSTTSPDRVRFWAGGTSDNQNIFDHIGIATFNMPNGW